MDGTWVELRVHGVSGTPPESLLATPELRTPNVEQVAGDEYSRFFRPVPAPDDHVLEAYHWGRFTSGSWRHALTLLLLPFGLINAAQFMLPHPVTKPGAGLHSVVGACLRGLALLLTALFSFAIGLILIDLLGWRWSAKTRLLDSFDVGKVLVGGVALAVAAVLALGFLGWSGRTREPGGSTVPPPDTGSRLGGRLFEVDPNAWALRRFHLGVGVAVVALLANLTHDRDPLSWNLFDWHGARLVTGVVLATAFALVTLGGDFEGAASLGWGPVRNFRRTLVGLIGWLVVVTPLVVTAVELSRVWQVERPNSVQDDPQNTVVSLPQFDDVANALMYVGVALLAILYVGLLSYLWRGPDRKWTRWDASCRLAAVAPIAIASGLTVRDQHGGWALAGWAPLVITLLLIGWCGYRIVEPAASTDDRHSFRPYAGGLAPSLVATLAVFIAIGFSAAAATAVSSTLGLDVTRGVKTGTTPMLDRVAYAWGLTVLELLALGLLLLLYFGARYVSFRGAVRRSYTKPDDETTVLPDGWEGRVVRATFIGWAKNLLPLIVIVFVVVGMLISGVQSYEMSDCDKGVCQHGPAGLDWVSEPRTGGAWAIPVINLGAWVFVVASGFLITISRGAIRDSGVRRGINVLWDIFGFWPHAVHPFAPRPYSRWTVVELRNRIRFHLGGAAGEPALGPPRRHAEVLVCAHSQGSVISLAALMLLTPNERDKVALLTCGSQLRVIYPRAFPAYFNLTAVTWVFDGLSGRWVNLYRATDPLAGPVLSWQHEAATSRHFPLPNPDDGLSRNDTWEVREDRTRRCGHDWRLIDPVPYDANVETGPVNAIHGHHDYWLDPGWERALAFLRARPGP